MKFALGQKSKNIKGVASSEGWWDQQIGDSGKVKRWLELNKEVSWKNRRLGSEMGCMKLRLWRGYSYE